MRQWQDFITTPYWVDQNGTSSACFTECLQYRPVLERRTGDADRAVLWVGMNPSTADAYKNDPTVKREMDFSAAWGFGRYIKANVCDYRSTDPKGLLLAPHGPRSEANLSIIAALAAEAEMIVVCHGLLPKLLRPLAEECTQMLRDNKFALQCMGLTKDGLPRHPLYLKATTLPLPY